VRKGQFEARLLLLVSFALVAFGLVMVYSATSASAALQNGDPAYYVKRQAIYAGLGLVLMFMLARLRFAALRRLAPTLVVTSLVLLAAVLVVGQAVNGARRWLTFGPFVFQPSEFAKLALAVWAAAFVARRRPPMTLKQLWRPVGALASLYAGLLLLEPDLGTAITIFLMLAGMLLISGTPVRALGGGLSIAAAVGLVAIWFEPYRRARIFAFVNPWHDAQGAGFQIVQAMIGLGSGGPFGVGLGQSVQKANYLPEAHTDMIFAIIGEELGLVGTTALIAAVMGLAPLTGIPLPFVSYGGSSLIVALAAVGILLNIAVGHGGEARAGVRDRGRGDGGTRAAGARRRRGTAGARRPRELRRVAGSRRSAARS
jgi:cell division protein FtsW